MEGHLAPHTTSVGRSRHVPCRVCDGNSDTYWQLADIHTKIHNSPTWIRLRDSIQNFDPSIDYSKLTPEDKP